MAMVIWIAYIFIDALVNWWWIEKKKSIPNYWQLLVVRGWAVIGIGILINVQEWQFWQWLGYCTTSFWLLFDVTLNVLRGKSIFYTGENSRIDSIGNKYPIVYWILKIIALIILITSIKWMI